MEKHTHAAREHPLRGLAGVPTARSDGVLVPYRPAFGEVAAFLIAPVSQRASTGCEACEPANEFVVHLFDSV